MSIATQKSFPNQAAENNLTSTGLVAVGFGFPASLVKIKNNGPGAAYLNAGSTSAGSTGGFKLSSGESLELRNLGLGISGFTLTATSTAVVCEYGAWG